ncbi:phosphoribosyltransferase family protein [Geitlerinema sp. PCC 9228]|uniref:phosphoribosyltransferase n=1 Tax=Geitlerinema sp. PCC 9228 TaxID=111611 RepID=UPI0008F99D38|nr:phosphoribosyltransferase family protein [Geitlerinema sp. PCC 9228]
MSASLSFTDRAEAGLLLAKAVAFHMEKQRSPQLPPSIVYALPRGGLPVAVPVAAKLNCSLGVMVTKKITLPDNEELAIGAVTADGHTLWSRQLSRQVDTEHAWQTAYQKALQQSQQLGAYCPPLTPTGRIALLVDDGMATGMTMMAAAQALRFQNPAQIWICAPVAPPEVVDVLQKACDRMVVLDTPEPFLSVSRFYQNFPQVDMETACRYLQEHNQKYNHQPNSYQPSVSH